MQLRKAAISSVALFATLAASVAAYAGLPAAHPGPTVAFFKTSTRSDRRMIVPLCYLSLKQSAAARRVLLANGLIASGSKLSSKNAGSAL